MKEIWFQKYESLRDILGKFQRFYSGRLQINKQS